MGRGRGRAPRVPYEPGPARNALIVSIEAAIALVLLIVSVAHTRLALYEEAYGFTMLRLYSHVFAGMAAVAFVLLGMAVAGVWRSRGWLPGAVIALAVATLVGLNTVNPEAIVVAANVQQARQTGRQDADYYYISCRPTPPRRRWRRAATWRSWPAGMERRERVTGSPISRPPRSPGTP